MPTHRSTAPEVTRRSSPAAAAPIRDRLPRRSAVLRGLLGWVVLNVSLGVSIGLVRVLDQRVGLSGVGSQLLQAALMTGLVVPTILLLRTRLDRRSIRGLGWSRRVGRPLLLGLGVGLFSALVAWGPALLAGWIRVEAVDLGPFVWFLVLNGLVLASFEALPEELALRGYTWTNLRDGWGVAVATGLTTLMFPFGGIVTTMVAAGVTTVFRAVAYPVSMFPADPATYILQLGLFGLALVAARRLPIEGALFIAVGFHWTQLTVTRTLLGGLRWLDTGWTTTLVQPDAVVLVLVHIGLAAVIFVGLRRRLARPRKQVRPTQGPRSARGLGGTELPPDAGFSRSG